MTRREVVATLYKTDARGEYVPCDVTFCTLSVSRKTGGDIRTLEKHVPTGSAVHLKRNRMVNLVPKEDRGKGQHTEHHVHLCLIMAVNGQNVNRGA